MSSQKVAECVLKIKKNLGEHGVTCVAIYCEYKFLF
jgi:hypothetical protein